MPQDVTAFIIVGIAALLGAAVLVLTKIASARLRQPRAYRDRNR
ncbi:hypothetical protein ACFOMD_02060 [Sphingoaurantiacus capsulatus]|uniref:Uncharacterized protein n=1 Tax=Sphingoaurantiacus capsulatus TaxID=1771310 RepID=A0ABV7X5X1_9SPHN